MLNFDIIGFLKVGKVNIFKSYLQENSIASLMMGYTISVKY